MNRSGNSSRTLERGASAASSGLNSWKLHRSSLADRSDWLVSFIPQLAPGSVTGVPEEDLRPENTDRVGHERNYPGMQRFIFSSRRRAPGRVKVAASGMLGLRDVSPPPQSSAPVRSKACPAVLREDGLAGEVQQVQLAHEGRRRSSTPASSALWGQRRDCYLQVLLQTLQEKWQDSGG